MRTTLILTLLLILASSLSAATLSTRHDEVHIYSSENPYIAEVVLVVPQNYPLDLLSESDSYYQVQDFQGRKGWIDKTAVESTSAVVIKVNNCNIRNGPGTNNEILFRANRGVAFKVLESQQDWVKVLHESGRQGWVYKNLLWGTAI